MVFYYSNSDSFFSVQYIIIEVNFGWFFRLFHFNIVSLFFIIIFFHFLKGLFFFSYRLKLVWFFGLLILLFLILIAFLGYVMVWAQISFWAGVVITRLLSVIPFFGLNLILFFWGAFVFGINALKFFFFLHFFFPFFLFILVFFHLFFLHFYGRTSKNFFFLFFLKKGFFPFYWFKDLINLFYLFFFFIFFLFFPFFFSDVLMFEDINFLVSPIHIVPEWYFLFAYAILRSVSNKFLGVILMLFRIIFFVFFVFLTSNKGVLDIRNKVLVFFLILDWFFLSFIGGSFLEPPFLFLGLFFNFLFFFIIFFILLNFFCSSFFF